MVHTHIPGAQVTEIGANRAHYCAIVGIIILSGWAQTLMEIFMVTVSLNPPLLIMLAIGQLHSTVS